MTTLEIIILIAIPMVFIAPTIVLFIGLHKLEKQRAKHEEEWLSLLDEISDDPEALSLWMTLGQMKTR